MMLLNLNNFKNPYTGIIQELKINGEEQDDDKDTDYTAEDQDENNDDDNVDDYTEDLPDDNNAEPAEDGGNETTDYTEDLPDDEEDTNEDDDEAPPSPDSGGGAAPAPDTNDGNNNDDSVDYTKDLPDGDNADSDNDEGNKDSDNSSNSDSSTDDGDNDDAEDEQSLFGMEKNLFSELTPQQMAIKNTELLQNYINLHTTLNKTFDNINKIPKTYTNTRLIDYISGRITELRDMVNYIITTTYVTRTYVENLTYYKECLMILTQISTILKSLVQSPAK